MATEFTQNRFIVLIERRYGLFDDYTNHVHFPIKVSELLDEQLDEASLFLLRVDRENIPPLTKILIKFWNGDESSTPTQKTFFVSSDSAEELPVGSGRYAHELYLIEETKWLERFIMPATGFVNALGRTYVE